MICTIWVSTRTALKWVPTSHQRQTFVTSAMSHCSKINVRSSTVYVALLSVTRDSNAIFAMVFLTVGPQSTQPKVEYASREFAYHSSVVWTGPTGKPPISCRRGEGEEAMISLFREAGLSLHARPRMRPMGSVWAPPHSFWNVILFLSLPPPFLHPKRPF